MKPTATAYLLLLSIITTEVSSQYCSYISKGTDDGFLECNRPAAEVEGIFVPDGNRIPELKKGLFSPFKKLTSIVIGNAHIQKIQPGAFDGLRLQVLHLNNNNIKTIEKGTFNSLNTTTSLEIFFNQLESLGADIFLGMTSLSWMSLSGNKIKTVDKSAFRGLESLSYLHMASNQIESLELGTFDSLVSLTLLDVSHSSLKEIKFGLFAYQRRLEKLNLAQNLLESLPDHVFDNLTAVNEIDVSQNKIRELQENLFYGIENLQILRFDSNNVSQFNARSLLVHVPKLSEVHLYNNPWKCDELKKMRGDFEIKNVFIPVPLAVRDSSNVDGIGCSE